MKKFSALLIIVVLFSLQLYCSASEFNIVKCENVEIDENNSFLIPVCIKNNQGIMGFKITLTYPDEYIKIISVKKGDVTNEGNFNSNVGVKSGILDVLWNNIDNVNTDGTLFILKVELKEDTVDSFEIKMNYSSADTFNANWEDVVLNCKSFKYNVSGNSQSSSAYEIISDSNESIINEANTVQVSTATEINTQGTFLTEINSEMTHVFSVIDESTAVDSEYIEDIKNNVNSEKIIQAVNLALESVNVKTIEDIPEEKYIDFINEFENNIKEVYIDFNGMTNDMTVDEAINDIFTLNYIAQKDMDFKKRKNSLIVALIIILAIFATVLPMLIIRNNIKKI